MTPGVGACLNHYEIIAPFGQGGVVKSGSLATRA